MATEELDEIIAKLEAIGEQLADRALGVLREALDHLPSDISDTADMKPQPDKHLLEQEKRLTKARRSVEKAAYLLSGMSQ